jgi:hypothetical protein
MKTYPTITPILTNQPIYAFDKLDGSNIRAEWNKKRGFYKFGSRKQLIGADDTTLGQSREMIVDTYADDLAHVFKDRRWDRAICFFEFHGPGSFAGLHKPGETPEVTLFDVAPHRKGILEPKVFLDLFGHLKHAELLYHGNPNDPFIQSVRDGTLEGMTYEGVVCKGKNISPGRPLMFKVKNQAWIDQVKALYANNEKLLKELL